MDTLAHHYPTSIFNDMDPKYWNPKISWKNKYKDGQKILGPAFFLSTGLLVAFTDAWHFFKSLQIVLLAAAIVMFPYTFDICLFDREWLNQLTWLVILGTVWNMTFSFMYNRVLKK
jgi:hypothetical protein